MSSKVMIQTVCTMLEDGTVQVEVAKHQNCNPHAADVLAVGVLQEAQRILLNHRPLSQNADPKARHVPL